MPFDRQAEIDTLMFRQKHLNLIEQAVKESPNRKLTAKQIYYRLVEKGEIDNSEPMLKTITTSTRGNPHVDQS